MNCRSRHLVIVLSVSFLFAACYRTKIIAKDVELSESPIAFKRETQWPLQSLQPSGLELCIEPTEEYGRKLERFGGHFVDAQGNPMTLSLTLVSPDGAAVTISPSGFVAARNLACFNLSRDVAPGHDRLEVRSAPPMRVRSVYWRWYGIK
jgi:hypothetical protein